MVENDDLNKKKIEDLFLISQKYDSLTLQNNKLVSYFVIKASGFHRNNI